MTIKLSIPNGHEYLVEKQIKERKTFTYEDTVAGTKIPKVPSVYLLGSSDDDTVLYFLEKIELSAFYEGKSVDDPIEHTITTKCILIKKGPITLDIKTSLDYVKSPSTEGMIKFEVEKNKVSL